MDIVAEQRGRLVPLPRVTNETLVGCAQRSREEQTGENQRTEEMNGFAHTTHPRIVKPMMYRTMKIPR